MIIPSMAGKAVHPHVCGDNALLFVADLISRGSPPRVWGQRTF